MEEIWQIMHHPAGKTGVAVGLTAGVAATLVCGTGKALFCLMFLTLWQYILHVNIRSMHSCK